MPNKPTVHYIPSNPPKREKRVGIYCRVSTNSTEQIQSLVAQVSHLTRLTATVPQWLLADVYMDIATSKTGSSRKEFNRMLVMLSNEKYTGDVELLKSSKNELHYLASGSHPAIISKETFEAVQIEKVRRSNVVKDENGSKRKSEKYSSKDK